MKLNSLKSPQTTKVPNNPLYTHFQVQIDSALRSTMDPNVLNIDSTSERFLYKMTPQDEEFFKDLYVRFGSFVPSEGHLHLHPDLSAELSSFNIGLNEHSLIEFLFTESNNLVMLGPVGSGKSTLLTYVYLFIVSHSSFLSKRIKPICVCLDYLMTDLANEEDPNLIWQKIFNDLISPHMAATLDYVYEGDNAEFWDYAMSAPPFLNMRAKYRNLKRAKDIAGLNALINDISTNKILPLIAASYLRQQKDAIPLLIIDNADPMSLPVQSTVLTQLAIISQEYHLKTIVSVRDTTWSKLCTMPDGPVGLFLWLIEPLEKLDVKNYLERRTQSLSKSVETRKITEIMYHGMRLTYAISYDLLKIFINTLLSRECCELLDNMSARNLRKMREMLRTYLRSGLIDREELTIEYLNHRIEYLKHHLEVPNYDKKLEIPIWILLKSIITSNHKMFYSKVLDESKMPYVIVNLFCNRKHILNSNFIRFHILFALCDNKEIDCEDIIEQYLDIFGDNKDNQHAFKYAIYRLFKGNLLHSPNKYIISDVDSVICLKDISISSVGKYYLQRLISDFDYIVLMKDDIFFRNDVQLKDCVDCDRKKAKYIQIYKLCEHLLENEFHIIHDLDKEKRAKYKSFMGDDESKIYVMEKIITDMHIYGINRPAFDQDIVSKFSVLHKKIKDDKEKI